MKQYLGGVELATQKQGPPVREGFEVVRNVETPRPNWSVSHHLPARVGGLILLEHVVRQGRAWTRFLHFRRHALRRRQGHLGRVLFKPLSDPFAADTEVVGPGRGALCLSVDGVHTAIIPHWDILRCCPFAIGPAIPLVPVESSEIVFIARSRPHVFKKRLKRIAPPLAYANASTTVVRILFPSWIAATLLYAGPHLVFRSPGA